MTSISAACSEAEANEIADVHRILCSEPRLAILKKLMEWGEVSAVGLSRSALSQHLGKMRAVGLISFRRDSQTL